MGVLLGRRAFEHFCMHTGGRGVLGAMEQQLRLPARMMQPSRAALWRCESGLGSEKRFFSRCLCHHDLTDCHVRVACITCRDATACAEGSHLCRYGNVSSSSIWYVLANIETMQVAPNPPGTCLRDCQPVADAKLRVYFASLLELSRFLTTGWIYFYLRFRSHTQAPLARLLLCCKCCFMSLRAPVKLT